MAFPDFNLVNECALEDWVDLATRKVKARRLCVTLFKELWVAASSEEVASTIMNVEANSYELVVSAIALQLFPHSNYVQDVEESLWHPARAPTVFTAIHNLKKYAACYLRLCDRHTRQVAIVNIKVRDALLNSLPVPVEQQLRLQQHDKTVQTIFQKAAVIEAELTRRQTTFRQFPTAVGQPDVTMGQSLRKPGKCNTCGAFGHWRKDC